MGGRRLYCHDGRLRYWYNLAGYRHLYMDGTTAVPADHHQVRTEFAYDGGGVGNDAHGLEECASDAPEQDQSDSSELRQSDARAQGVDGRAVLLPPPNLGAGSATSDSSYLDSCIHPSVSCRAVSAHRSRTGATGTLRA